jgi:F0F1-type ATP synthase assembly protein I
VWGKHGVSCFTAWRLSAASETMIRAFVTPVSSNTIGDHLLDRWLKTDPWMFIAGIVLGLPSAGIDLIRIMNRVNRSD